jgi:integrase
VGHIRDRWKDPARKGKGKRWQVKYTVDGREKDGGSYEVKAVAQRRLVELEAAVHRGQWVDPTDRTTVAEYARRWAAGRPHRPTTAERVERFITRQLEGTSLGRRRLAGVRPSDVQSWVTTLSVGGMAPSTVRLCVRQLAAIFNAAALDHLVSTSPVTRLSLPRSEDERIVPLVVDQVAALATAMPERNRAMVYVQAGLGLRIGELLALRAADVDFLRRTARVEHQLARYTRERVDPKTPRSRRTIPLPATVGERLAAHMAKFPPGADGSLFTGVNGRPYDHAVYGTRIFGTAVAKVAGAKGSTLPADTVPHDLRHHFASVLLAAGLSVVDVAELLGHENASMVLRVYGHLIPGGEDRMRKAVDAAWTAGETAPGDAPTAQGRPE